MQLPTHGCGRKSGRRRDRESAVRATGRPRGEALLVGHCGSEVVERREARPRRAARDGVADRVERAALEGHAVHVGHVVDSLVEQRQARLVEEARAR